MKKFSVIILSFLGIFFLTHPLTAQEHFNLTGGTGIPEQVNLGVRMQVDQSQYGLSIGTSPGYKNKNFTFSGDFYYHFGGRSRQTQLQPWYFKPGLTFLSSEGEWEKRSNLLLITRLGRDVNMTPQFGVALEAGIMLMLINHNAAKKEKTDAVTGDLDLIGDEFIIPSVGLKFFYRLF